MQLLVLGCHRSGTSSVARLLNMMGCSVGQPENLLPPNKENPKGFWENTEVVDINKQVLEAVGARWDRVAHFSSAALQSAKPQQHFRDARKIITRLDSARPWLIKDPRLCLTLEFWKPLLELPVYVLVSRHPVEVAKSLLNRNGIPLEVGIALWERYTVEALAAVRGGTVIHVHYNDLMRNPLEAVTSLHDALLQIGVRRIEHPAEAEINAFLSPDLHREHAGITELNQSLNDQQLALYNTLLDNAAIQDYVPAGVSAAAIATMEAYETQNPVEPENLLSQRAVQERRYTAIEQAVSTTQAESTAAARKLVDEVRQVAGQLREREKMDARVQALEIQRDTYLDKLEATRQELEAQSRRLEHAHNERQQLLAQVKESKEYAKQVEDFGRQELSRLQDQHRLALELATQEHSSALAALQSECDEQANQVLEALQELASRGKSVEHGNKLGQTLRAALRDAQKETSRLQDELAQRKQERKTLKARWQHAFEQEAAEYDRAVEYLLRRLEAVVREARQLHAARGWRAVLKPRRPELPIDRVETLLQQTHAWEGRRRLKDAKRRAKTYAGGTAVGKASFLLYRKDYLLLLGWMEELGEAIEKMEVLWWWRLGLRARAPFALMGIRSRYPNFPIHDARAILDKVREWEKDTLPQLEADGLSAASLRVHLDHLAKWLDALDACIQRMAKLRMVAPRDPPSHTGRHTGPDEAGFPHAPRRCSRHHAPLHALAGGNERPPALRGPRQ